MITAKQLLILLLYVGSAIAFAAAALSTDWSLPITLCLLSIAALGSAAYLRMFVYFFLHARDEWRILARYPQLESRLERHWLNHPEPETPSLTETRQIMNLTQAITLSLGLVCTLTAVGLIWRMI